MQRNPGFRDSSCLDEKGVLSGIGFNEVLVLDTQNGRHQAGESCAAAEIGPTSRPGGSVAKQLGGVEDMPPPDVG